MCYLISACLVGDNCKYQGGNNLHERVKSIYEKGTSITVCPEVLGGLGVPRPQTEITEGGGEEVFAGKSKVVTKNGEDVTVYFIRGAQRALEYGQARGIKKAILKSRSPSCGFQQIYDGTFSGNIKKGNGIFAQLLYQHAFEIKTEEDV